jgi:deoxyribodipyrimidine photolyase
LVKDLLIDWRKGEQYFMSQLIDGDLAANNGGWQWAASTGTDAAPYFRIFNPTTQGEKFDRDGGLSASGCRNCATYRVKPFMTRGRGQKKRR